MILALHSLRACARGHSNGYEADLWNSTTIPPQRVDNSQDVSI